MSNKYLIVLIFLQLPVFIIGQVSIVGKIITWKTIDEIDAAQILLTLNRDTLLFNTYEKQAFSLPGQYPLELFKLNSAQIHGRLKTVIRYGKFGDNKNWYMKENEVQLSGREYRIEIEYHFQEYSGATEKISADRYYTYPNEEKLSALTIHKIYKLPEGLILIPVWDYKVESNPKYIISNNSGYLIYGQAGDGYCEGILYKKGSLGNYERYYTGGYDYDQRAENPLYNGTEMTSTIRDHRQPQQKFLLSEPGQYRYVVRLGFAPYELSSRYGSMPFYSIEHAKVSSVDSDKYIKEYFELSDEFEIK